MNLVGLTSTAGVNRAPEFDANIENQLVFVAEPENNYSNNESQTLSFNVSAVDPDGDAVTLFAVKMPPGMSFAETLPGNGTFTWTPDFFQSGDWEVIVRGSDGSAWTDRSVIVRVADVARGPAFVPPSFVYSYNATTGLVQDVNGAWMIDEGMAFFGFVHAVDPDGSTLSYSAENLPAGASFDPATRMFSWRPGFDQGDAPDLALYNVTFNATDGTSFAAEKTFFAVANWNRGPIALAPFGVDVVARHDLVAQAPFTDLDLGDPLVDESLTFTPSYFETRNHTYDVNTTLYTYENGITLNETTGEILWSPTDADVGSHALVLNATDAFGSWTTATFTITVLANQAPVVVATGPALVDVFADAAFSGYGSFDPEDAGELTYVWTFESQTDPANYTATAEGMNVTHAFDFVGAHNVTLTVTDADGVVGSAQIVVNVDDVILMDLEVIQEGLSLISGVGGYIRLTDWDNTGLANTPIAIQVFHHSDSGDEIVSEFTVTTDANGEVNFVVPRDEGLFNRLGSHTIVATTFRENTLNADTELAEAQGEYEVGIL